MGITGLLPFLEKSKVSKPVNIRELSGCTVAADAYCWLHKGAFACADKLARGEETDMFVQYCMKYVNMLLSHNIKPILVFDGRHLPAKAATEKKRREKRDENRKQAASLLRQGHSTEALSFLRRCIDVTHKMALTVMKECRKRNVDCIVAPYEADAQLAFFSLEHIADFIITEDSDLLLFGCTKVMFKLDLAGNGILVDQSKLYQCMGVRPEMYSFDKFRYMCILSGCDYLESLPGIGLGKACKFISRTQDPDIHKALSRLPSQLNIRGLSVPLEYRDAFMKADAMFRHQLVFDPQTRKTRPLTPFQCIHPSSPLAAGPLPGCEPEFEDEICYQLALGNLDPFKLEKVDDYNPDIKTTQSLQIKTTGWSQNAVAPHPSIWNVHYKDSVTKQKPLATPSFMFSESRPVTKGKVKTVDTSDIIEKNTKKRSHTDDHEIQASKKPCSYTEESNLAALYATPSSSSPCRSPIKPTAPEVLSDSSPTSPILCGKRQSKNPFARSSPSDSLRKDCNAVSETSFNSTPSSISKDTGKFGALSKFARAIHRTSTEGKPVIQSRYFNSDPPSLKATKQESDQEEEKSCSSLLRDVSNTMNTEDVLKEQLVSMGYVQNASEKPRSPMIHKKPLFTSSPNTLGSNCSSDVDFLKADMHERFSKQNTGPKLTSPCKNPFRKKAISEKSAEVKNLEIQKIASVDRNSKMDLSFCLVTPEEEDVDDPGLEFCSTPPSTSLLTNVCSQPDEGFESPSKTDQSLRSPTIMSSKSSEFGGKNQACRIPGLRKTASTSGQSKLSAFGFLAKPKIQRT